MADDYGKFAEDVVKLIVEHIKAVGFLNMKFFKRRIFQSANDLKIIGIYIMDSIIKFSGDTMDKYRRLFGNEIVKLFVDTFEKVYW